jgi:hypothetical protein
MWHSTVAVTEKYSHTNIDSLRRAIEHIDSTEKKTIR